jgi:hypothetical protein
MITNISTSEFVLYLPDQNVTSAKNVSIGSNKSRMYSYKNIVIVTVGTITGFCIFLTAIGIFLWRKKCLKKKKNRRNKGRREMMMMDELWANVGEEESAL